MKILTRFDGVVLTGGRSSRMGVDKAFVAVGSPPIPMVSVSRDALLGAGAVQVLSIGGDQERLANLGFDAHPDDHPDEGPLGGLVTGLRLAAMPIVVVLTCDLPAIDSVTIRSLVQALDLDPAVDAAVPRIDGRDQIITAAYRRRAYDELRASFDSGERSVRRAVEHLRVAALPDLDRAALTDVDRPEDLSNYASREAGGDRPAPFDQH